MMKKELDVLIIGAGPAGLTASYLLTKQERSVCVLEADPISVGGISRTVRYKGYHFDIGGHRFFSKSSQVEALWSELLPDDLIHRPRSSRIYYRKLLFDYPLKAFDALGKLGVWESLRCVLSYGKAQLFPVKNPKNFQDWTSNQFGKRLFEIFFKTYTEKVWGMSCKEISADWSAQRVKGLSLGSAIWDALIPKQLKGDGQIKSLINSFRYPRKGPGMLWEAAAEKTREQGGEVLMGCRANGLRYDAETARWQVSYTDAAGESHSVQAKHVISSAPLRELIHNLSPAVDPTLLAEAKGLKYRDFILVALVVKERNLFQDNWIYIHDPGYRVGRIQNFKSWSEEMVPDPDTNCYGMEYFCFENNALWNSSDEQLQALAEKELIDLGLAKPGDILDAKVVRQVKAYPVYDEFYAEKVRLISAYLDKHYPNLHPVGRNGMHKYNNQDHAMMTAMLTVENILADKTIYDVWAVNQDAEYHETDASRKNSASGLRQVPTRVKAGRP